MFDERYRNKVDFSLSFFQIYNECIYDLLADPKLTKSLKIRESIEGNVIENLSECPIENEDECFELLAKGDYNRKFRETSFNEASSRSHCIVQIVVDNDQTSIKGILTKGKLLFCDLGGCEKHQNDIGVEKAQLKEQNNINTSLCALRAVIKMLGSNPSKYIPYRNSKLTRILEHNLGKGTRTVLIATISPFTNLQHEIASTLEFAKTSRSIKI